MSPAVSVDEAAATVIDESLGRHTERYVDLRLLVEDKQTGDVLLDVGGEWDRLAMDWSGEEQDLAMLVKTHPGQREGMEVFADWLSKRASGEAVPPDERLHALIFSGGERAGKTFLACGPIAVATAIALPGLPVWIVCPSDSDFDEVEDYLEGTMPAAWYERVGTVYTLANGSTIKLWSGHDPEMIKKGGCVLLILQEAQRLKGTIRGTAEMRTADYRGLLVATLNPPKPNARKGQWVEDWVVEADDDNRKGDKRVQHVWFDPRLNDAIDQEKILYLAEKMDKADYERTVLGILGVGGNKVFYNWVRNKNEKTAPPAEFDITAELLRWREGREFDSVIGADFQRQPMVGIELKFFDNPLTHGAPDVDRFLWCHAWVVREFILYQASEEDLADAWIDAGIDPDRTLVVADASGQTQFGERRPGKVLAMRSRWKGRGSWAVLERKGFVHLATPEAGLEKNPEIAERLRATITRVATKKPGKYGRRFFFVDPSCERTTKAARTWPRKGGVPHRTHKAAHIADGITYPMHRLFGEQRPMPTVPEVRVVSRFQGRNRVRGW